MRQVAFSVYDLDDKAWPQLLDVDMQVQVLMPYLVQNLGLRRNLNYALIPKGANLPLDGRHSLADYRIPGGSELYIRVVRDPLLEKLLDELYSEAKDLLKDQLKEAAKEKLLQLLHLDPSHPDPLGLKQQLLGYFPPSPGPAGSGHPAQGPGQGPSQPQFQSSSQTSQRSQIPKPPKSGAGRGCLIAGILGGGLLLLGAGLVAAVFLFRLISVPPVVTPTEQVLGTGDVQVTLRWDAPVDLDLYVTDPAGEVIFYDHRSSNTGGILDVDANAGCDSILLHPVENVYWPYGASPSGQYQVSVVMYSICDFTGSPGYEVTIKQDGRVVNVLTGTLSQSEERQFVTSFSR